MPKQNDPAKTPRSNSSIHLTEGPANSGAQEDPCAPPVWAVGDKPFRILGSMALILLGALLLGVVLPGTVAHFTGTFYAKDVEAIVSRSQDAETKKQYAELQAFNRTRQLRQEELRRLEALLVESSKHPENLPHLEGLARTHDLLRDSLSRERPPMVISGFYLGDLLMLWPALYLSLGLLVFVLRPHEARRTPGTIRRVLLLFLGIVVLHRWPMWWRNSGLGQMGRTIYVGVNLDVSPVAFFTQEFMAIAVDALLAVVWWQWVSFLTVRSKELRTKIKSPLKAAFDHQRLERLSRTFVHWQVSSLVLCAGFSYYIYFYWHAVTVERDVRYVVSAVVIHFLWGATWLLLTLPLLLTWHHWFGVRTRALAELAEEGEATGDAGRKLAILSEFKPIPTWNLVTSSVSAFVAFTLPLFQLLWKP